VRRGFWSRTRSRVTTVPDGLADIDIMRSSKGGSRNDALREVRQPPISVLPGGENSSPPLREHEKCYTASITYPVSKRLVGVHSRTPPLPGSPQRSWGPFGTRCAKVSRHAGSTSISDRAGFLTTPRSGRRSASAPAPHRQGDMKPSPCTLPAGRSAPIGSAHGAELDVRAARPGFDFSLLSCRTSSAASARSQSLKATIFGNPATVFGHTIQ
jgi:hypothetical protein